MLSHACNHGFAHKHRRPRTRTAYGTNRHVRRAQRLLQHRGLKRRRPEPLAHGVLQSNQPVHAVVKHLHARAQTQGRAGGKFSHRAGPQDDHFARTHAAHATKHGALATDARHELARHKHGGVAGDFSHRTNQRLNAILVLDEVPSDGGGFFGAECLQQALVLDAQLQGRDQDLPHAHQGHFFQRRRLDLQHNVRLEDLPSVVHDSRPCLAVVVVGELRLRACLGLHQHLVPVGHKQGHGFRDQGHALFLKACLCWNANGQLRLILLRLQKLLLRKQGRLSGQCFDCFAS